MYIIFVYLIILDKQLNFIEKATILKLELWLFAFLWKETTASSPTTKSLQTSFGIELSILFRVFVDQKV